MFLLRLNLGYFEGLRHADRLVLKDLPEFRRTRTRGRHAQPK